MKHQNGQYGTEKLLVQGILDGDKEAFKILIKNTERMVAGIVCKMITNTHDQRDMVQETYLKVYNSLPAFRFRSKLSTWVAAIAYNSCVDHLRRKKAFHALETIKEDAAENEDTVFFRDRSALLQSAIGKLPPVYRTLIVMFHNHEMSYEEIAEITRMPVGTVKNYLFRARKTLKNALLVNYRKEDI